MGTKYHYICALLMTLFLLHVAISSAHAATSSGSTGRVLNVRLMPVGTLLNEYWVDANFGILRPLSIGVIGYSVNSTLGDVKAKGSGYGALATLYFTGNRISTSWIMTAYWYRVRQFDLTDGDMKTSFSNVSEMGAVLGRMWVFGSGFNITLAGGVRRMTGPANYSMRNDTGTHTKTVTNSEFSGLSPRLEFALGWAF
jgi:hypothetical protein